MKKNWNKYDKKGEFWNGMVTFFLNFFALIALIFFGIFKLIYKFFTDVLKSLYIKIVAVVATAFLIYMRSHFLLK